MHTLETISNAPYLLLPKFQRTNTRKVGLRTRHKDLSEYYILALFLNVWIKLVNSYVCKRHWAPGCRGSMTLYTKPDRRGLLTNTNFFEWSKCCGPMLLSTPEYMFLFFPPSILGRMPVVRLVVYTGCPVQKHSFTKEFNKWTVLQSERRHLNTDTCGLEGN